MRYPWPTGGRVCVRAGCKEQFIDNVNLSISNCATAAVTELGAQDVSLRDPDPDPPCEAAALDTAGTGRPSQRSGGEAEAPGGYSQQETAVAVGRAESDQAAGAGAGARHQCHQC